MLNLVQHLRQNKDLRDPEIVDPDPEINSG
jgi:hypothetical protein